MTRAQFALSYMIPDDVTDIIYDALIMYLDELFDITGPSKIEDYEEVWGIYKRVTDNTNIQYTPGMIKGDGASLNFERIKNYNNH